MRSASSGAKAGHRRENGHDHSHSRYFTFPLPVKVVVLLYLKTITLISVFKKALIVDLEVRKPHPRSQSVVPSHSLPWVTTMIAHEKSLAGLAQSVERLTEEREVARSIPRAGPVFRVLK